MSEPSNSGKTCDHPMRTREIQTTTWSAVGTPAPGHMMGPSRREVRCLRCGDQWVEVPKRITVTWMRKPNV